MVLRQFLEFLRQFEHNLTKVELKVQHLHRARDQLLLPQDQLQELTLRYKRQHRMQTLKDHHHRQHQNQVCFFLKHFFVLHVKIFNFPILLSIFPYRYRE